MSEEVEKAGEKTVAPSPSREVFYVAPDGETTGEIEHLKQVGLEIEQLSDSNPSTSIDTRKIAADGYSGLSGIQIMLLDYGIPPRMVTIKGDFQTSAEVNASDYDAENDSSPNTLTIHAPRTQHDTSTFNTDWDSMDYQGYGLRRGKSLYLAHNGEPISTRTNFLDEFDELGVSEYGEHGRYENIIKLTYEGHELKIETQNHSQAIIIYGKSVGFADRHAVVEDLPEEIKSMLEAIEDEETRNAVLELHSRLAKLAVEHEVTLGDMETMEALLAHNKFLLRDERSKVWRLKNENERLQAQTDSSSSDNSDWLRSALGGQASGARTELERNCERIGLNPAIASTDPELVLAAAKSMRKVWARKLHPDVSEEDGESLKEINAAIDAIVGHFE